MAIYGNNGNNHSMNTPKFGKTQARVEVAVPSAGLVEPAEPVLSTVPQWFNDTMYMRNKSAQSGVSTVAVKSAFEGAGFYGEYGNFLHFMQYGQWEDVSPAASFDAGYYYKAKAADFYTIDVAHVADIQAQSMRDGIHNAGLNAWSHYQQYGTREGIDASAAFDTGAYMEAKLAQVKKTDPGYTMEQLFDAFASAGLSAVAHYEAYGREEGLRAANVPDSVKPAPEPTPVKNEYIASVAVDDAIFTDGSEDTFVTSFGSGRATVVAMDMAKVHLGAYEYLYAGEADLSGFFPGWDGELLFINMNPYTLSGERLAQNVAREGFSPWGWLMYHTGGTEVQFMHSFITEETSLYGAYPTDIYQYITYYSSIPDRTVTSGIAGTLSDSVLWYNLIDVIIDTITGFNPVEDRIDVPTKITSLVKGGKLVSLSNILGEVSGKISANQAGLFQHEGDYYLFINDENPVFDANVDISIKLVGLSAADAASMDAGIFV